MKTLKKFQKAIATTLLIIFSSYFFTSCYTLESTTQVGTERIPRTEEKTGVKKYTYETTQNPTMYNPEVNLKIQENEQYKVQTKTKYENKYEKNRGTKLLGSIFAVLGFSAGGISMCALVDDEFLPEIIFPSYGLASLGIYFMACPLISGSGPQNRDEELLGHKPFLVLADHLTKNGIAVLRFDDRGIAESTGDFQIATSLDFARDVEFAIKYLQTRKEINKNQIGLVGHSEGGIIAPIVAAEFEDINFIVLLAGTGIRGNQLLLLQQELIGKASGINDTELQKAKVINEGAFDIVLKSNNTDSLKRELTDYIKQALKDNPGSEKPEGMSEDDYVKLQVNQLTSPWMQFFIKYDPSIILEKVKCPVLAINGAKDLQVSPKVNLDAIKKALEKGGNKNVTTKELPNLNHLFQECETGLPSEYVTIEQTFSPIALDEITKWILKQVK